MDVAIVADDLTGAADAAAEFVGRDWRVHVALSLAAGEQADVLAVDTDSRERNAEEAARRVAAAVRALATMAPRRWFKKMDSTLRGNVAAELAAFRVATAASMLVVAPAFPAQQRSYVDGALRCDGPAPAGPPARSHLPTLLAGCPGTRLLLPLHVVRAGPAALGAHLLAAPENTFVIGDAVENADLDAIVAAAEASGRPIAYAGSAGLAAALGRWNGAAAASAPPLSAPADALFVVGSVQPVARRQLAVAADCFGPALVLPANGPYGRSNALLAAMAEPSLRRSGAILLTTPDEEGPNRRAFAALVGKAAAELIVQHAIRRVFVTGGELARDLCERLNVTLLVVRGQVLEGVPALLAVDGLPGLHLVTKAGGFGDDDTLLRVYRYLAGREGRSA